MKLVLNALKIMGIATMFVSKVHAFDKKEVAVIGGGPAGLVAGKEFQTLGHKVTLYESSKNIGGQWNLQNSRSAVWSYLNMNTPRHMIEFSDFGWDDFKESEETYSGTFPKNRESQAYLEAYAKNFSLYDKIKLSHKVTSVSKSNEEWLIEFEQVTADGTKAKGSKKFDLVVFATGMFGKPSFPLKDKLSGFTGEVIHSHEFKNLNKESLKDKKIMVIGNSVSGTEIVTEVVRSEASKPIFHAIRKPRYHINTLRKDRPFETTEETFFQRLPVYLNRYLPQKINSEGLKKVVLEAFPEQLDQDDLEQKFTLDSDIDKAGISISRYDYVADVKSKKVAIKKIPNSGGGKCLEFDDHELINVDLIIMATGYQLDIPYLSETVKKDLTIAGTQDLALYNYVLHPTETSLAFIGFQNIIGAVWPALEMQARYAAQQLSSLIERPKQDKIDSSLKDLQQLKVSAGPYVVASHIQEDLGDLLKVTPSRWKCLLNPKENLLAPLFPCNYRTNPNIEGPEVANSANLKLKSHIEHQKNYKNPSD